MGGRTERRRGRPGGGPVRLWPSALVAVAVFVAAGLLGPAGAGACDPGNFVIDEFARGCAQLAETAREAEVATRLDLPAAPECRERLRTAYVKFFLEHGRVPPPSVASLATTTWQAATQAMGEAVLGLGREGATTTPDLTALLLPVDLLGDPAAHFRACSVMASWGAVLALPPPPPGEQPMVLQGWLAVAAFGPARRLTDDVLRDFPGEAQRLGRVMQAVLDRVAEPWGVGPWAGMPPTGTASGPTPLAVRSALEREFARLRPLLLY